MNAAIALVVIQFLITMMFYPLRIGAKGHASLARDRMELDLTLFRLPVARVRIKKSDNKFVLQLNGKTPDKNKKVSVKQMTNVLKQYKVEGIRAKGNLLALISADDAKNTAIAYAVLIGIVKPLLNTFRIYTAQPSDTLEIDGSVRVKINMLQIIGLLAAGLSK